MIEEINRFCIVVKTMDANHRNNSLEEHTELFSGVCSSSISFIEIVLFSYKIFALFCSNDFISIIDMKYFLAMQRF